MVMRGKVCLVTGANRGIGREIAAGLARSDAKVLITARTRENVDRAVAELRAETGNPDIHGFAADYMHQHEVRRLAAEVIAFTDRLDVLVNNAGAFFMYRTLTEDNHEATFAVNHLAPFILTNALVDLMKASAPARIVNLSSEAHSRATNIEDWESRGGYTGYQAYARSKLANILFTYDLAHRLEGTGVTVNAVHPGVVETGLMEGILGRWWMKWTWPIARRFTITPAEGAEGPLMLAQSPEMAGVTGRYFKQTAQGNSSLISHDPTIGARLWNISLRYTGELPEVEITGEHIAG